MGSIKDFIQLPKRLKINYYYLLLRRFKISVILYIILIIAITLPYRGEASTPWPVLQITSGKAENLIADERDGSIFIVVKDNIYKYDDQFKLLTSTEPTSGKVSHANLYSNMTNKLLHIVKKSSPNLLLSCWVTPDKILHCWVNKLIELSQGNVLMWKASVEQFKLDLNNKVLALGGDLEDSEILMVTSNSAFNSSSVNSFLPTISKFEIVKTNNRTKLLALEQKSVLLYQLHFEEQVSSYIYLFRYEHYTYLILNNIKKTIDLSVNGESQNNVKIARMCNKDNNFTSYTEVTLTCNDKTNLQATSAFLYQSESDPTLYVVFEEVLESLMIKFNKPSGKSSICSYSVRLIDDIISKAVADCHDGFQTSNLLNKFNLDKHHFPCLKSPSSNVNQCESKANPFIDGTSYRYNIKEDSYMSLEDITLVNFIYATNQGSKLQRVLYIGTEFGYLTKLSSDEDLFFTVNTNNLDVRDYQLGDKLKSRIALPFTGILHQKGVKYSVGKRAIYAIANDSQTISRFDIDACHYYRTCISCLSIRDPLDCVWCGNSCSQRSECEATKQLTESCPPIIKNFYPKIGPLTGFTRLRVEGENFGHGKGSLSMKIGKQNCSLDLKQLSNEYLECTTQPVEAPINATISIDVDDETNFIFFKGSVDSLIPFSFVKIDVFGLMPQYGPFYNANTLEILGNNLNAGSNRSIFIGNTECEIKNIKADAISCYLKADSVPKPNIHNLTNKEVGELKLIVDGTEQTVDLLSYTGPSNLSTYFTFIYDSVSAETTTMTTFQQPLIPESESNLQFLVLVSAILVSITFIVIYLIRSEKITTLRLKMPTLFESSGSKIDDTKVSFRNPQSHKFSNAGSAFGSESINGLVKLNGSVMSSDYFCKPEQLEQDQPLMSNFLDNELLALLMQEKILIDRNRLTLGHVLGSGQFGRVYKGFLKVDDTGEHAAVAVKTLHSRSSWDDTLDNRAFLEEGLMMKDFEHDNVLALIGVTFDANGLPMVITPFMLYGDLRSYISDEASSPSVKELIDFGTQVARGMAYLSGLKFVHRDLAARNCMLDDNLIVKVADFGLSRDIYERDYYSSDNKKAKLPVKWMAIESLEKCIYNTKTDVWSYGVLLWELMTRGVVPYPDVDNFDLFSYLKEGRRMLRPRYCPVILYKIMLSCWEENPARRPTFVQLVTEVSDVITQLRIAKDGQQKVSRDVTYCDVLK